VPKKVDFFLTQWKVWTVGWHVKRYQAATAGCALDIDMIGHFSTLANLKDCKRLFLWPCYHEVDLGRRRSRISINRVFLPGVCYREAFDHRRFGCSPTVPPCESGDPAACED